MAPSSSALTAAVVAAAVCVVLVSLDVSTTAQEIRCSECGPYCEAACGGVPEGGCDGGSCYAFPELCPQSGPQCGSASSAECASHCFDRCKSTRCRAAG